MTEAGPVEDLEDLFENAPCGYLSLAPDGRIVKCNATFSAWVGYSAEALSTKRFLDLLNIAGGMFYETHFSPLLRMQGYFNEVALDIVTAAGARLPVMANAVVRRDADGELRFIRITVFKAAERRRYERDLVDAKAATQTVLDQERELSHLREQFIAVLGHDLRNPLTSILGVAKMLLRRAPDEQTREYLRLMIGSADRMSTMIDNVLDLARGQLGSGIDINAEKGAALAEMLTQVVEELRTGTDRTILAEIELTHVVSCDASRVGQLVSNLIGNALTHGASDRPVWVRAQTREGYLEISVSNYGMPIPPETMERLFQPFFRGQVRRSQQGLGLGLFIASEIAKAHGGTLAATSSDTETSFTFRMPLAA